MKVYSYHVIQYTVVRCTMEYLATSGLFRHCICICPENIAYKLQRYMQQGIHDISCFLHIEHNYIVKDKILEISLREGYLELVKYLYRKGYHTTDENLLNIACANGQLRIVEWFIKIYKDRYISAPIIFTAICKSCENGHLPIIKWFFKEFYFHGDYSILIGDCSRLINIATIHGHLHLVEWMYEHGCKVSTYTFDIACCYGHIHLAKWFYKKGYRCTPCAMDKAIENGHLDIVKLLCEKGDICTLHARNKALKNGHFHVVKWIDDNGYKHNPFNH